MALTSVRETWSGRSGSLDDSLQRQYTRIFRVHVDDLLDGPLEIMFGSVSGASIPRLFAPYTSADGGEFDNGAYLRNIHPQQSEENPYTWDVTCEYSSQLGQAPNPQQRAIQANRGAVESSAELTDRQNPLTEPPEYELSYQTYSKPISHTPNGTAIASSAGEPFIPPVEIDADHLVLRISRNEIGLPLAIAAGYQNTTNSDTWLGFAPDTVRVRIGARSVFINGLFLWRVTYEFLINLDTWFIALTDHGSFWYDNGTESPKSFLDDHGHTITKYLDGTGQPLADGADPVVLEFRGYQSLPFAALGVP